MTRENKLALVVGFGLILFVAILVSDHFSDAQNAQAADLTTDLALLPASHATGDDLIDIGTASPEASPAAPGDGSGEPPLSMPDLQNPPTQPLATESEVRPILPGFLPVPGSPCSPAAGASAAAPGSPPLTSETDSTSRREPMFPTHHVEAGESLTVICRRFYGDDSLVKALAKFNQITDPDTVRIGHRLRIPPASILTSFTPVTGGGAAPPPAERPRGPKYGTHVLQKGETLAAVARKYLGSPARWGEIAALNREAVENPDEVKAGTTLKVPLKN
jgi:nucleoid-associated protein YgaU